MYYRQSIWVGLILETIHSQSADQFKNVSGTNFGNQNILTNDNNIHYPITNVSINGVYVLPNGNGTHNG
jgi:hypothetical protein